MKINPFKAFSQENLIVFANKEREMYLKQYIVKNIMDVNEILKNFEKNFEKNSSNFQDRIYCLEINYQGGKNFIILSINVLISDLKLESKIIKEEIKKSEKEIIDKISHINSPYEEYISLLRGNKDFILSFKESMAYFLTEDKQEREIQAFYRINLRNSGINSNIFKLMDDLGSKMKKT
ncbi:MAG: hypothetical protein ACTSUE_23890 [Promethearchaeota archaeon]